MNQPNSDNPAWASILNVIPAEFHHLVKPHLQEWDKNVNQKFTEIHAQYEPYKGFQRLVENGIEPSYAENAVKLADQLQRDPKSVVQQVNDAWNLGYVPKDQVQSPAGNSTGDQGDDDFFDPDDDIMKHPKVKALHDGLNQLQSQYERDKQAEEMAASQAEWEEYFDDLEDYYKEQNLPFNRKFVIALVSQGVQPEDAVKEYHTLLAEQSVTPEAPAEQPSNNQPPPVMGSDGSVGSGLPDGSVDFGVAMRKNDLNASVEEMLRQAAESGQ